MSVLEKQRSLIEGIEAVVDKRMSRINTPEIKVGVVVQDPAGFECIVDVQGTEMKCTLPEHLHDWVSKDDIVYVTDTRGNGADLVVTGSSGTKRDQSLVVNDEERGRLVGGVTKFEDSSGALTDNDLIVTDR